MDQVEIKCLDDGSGAHVRIRRSYRSPLTPGLRRLHSIRALPNGRIAIHYNARRVSEDIRPHRKVLVPSEEHVAKIGNDW